MIWCLEDNSLNFMYLISSIVKSSKKNFPNSLSADDPITKLFQIKI